MGFFYGFLLFALLCCGRVFTSATCTRPSFQVTFPKRPQTHPPTYVKFSSTFTFESTKWSLCYWAKRIASNELHVGVTFRSDTSGDWYIWTGINIYNEGFFVISNVNRCYSRPLPVGQWIHMCFIRSDRKLELYINGNNACNHTCRDSLPTPVNGTFSVGQLWNSPWVGDISEVQVWNRAINQTEVDDLANCKSTEEGNIISWGESDMEFYGGLDFKDIPMPCARCN